MKRIFFTCCIAMGFVATGVAERRTAAAEPVPIILDTDIENDVDDVGAVALLHALADLGEAKILAMGVSVKHPWSAPCLDALNTYYGRPEIRIGIVNGPGVDAGSKYAKTIAQEFPHRLDVAASHAPDAVSLYRHMLADAPDGSVVFVSIGFLTNVARLLDSSSDAVSSLSGIELVRRKVRLWGCMGGKFPEGREWNLFQDAAASQSALKRRPTPIVFSGFEIGEKIQTGAALADVTGGPVRRSYELYNGLKNRSSWDQTAVLYAVRGAGDLWELSRPGTIEVLPNGANRWHDAADGRDRYLVRKAPDEQVAKTIDALMIRPPRK